MRKYISIVIAIVLLVGAFFIANAFIFNKENKPRREKIEKTATTVVTQTVTNTTIPIVVEASGSLLAKNRVELFSEVQGVFRRTRKEFKPGVRYNKGEVFLEMDSEEQYANLLAQKSTLYNLITVMLPDLKIDYPEAFPKWESYVEKFDLEKEVPKLPEPSTTKERIFVSAKNVYTTYYNIKSLEIRQDKYVLTAPFNGVLTETLITPGTLVRPGQQLGEFISSDVFEMEVAVGVSILPFMKVGKEVTVRSLVNSEQTWTGKVVRVNGKVDRTSQTASVYLELRGKNLEEGMYLEATINAREEENVYEIDRRLLINDEKVYAIRDSALALIEVTPVYFGEDKVVVKGMKDGEKILSKTVPGAYEGMGVQILAQ